MENFSTIGSHISHNNKQTKEIDSTQQQHLSRAPSAMDPLMTGTATLQSHIQTQPTLLMQNGIPTSIVMTTSPPLMAASGNAAVGPPTMLTTSSASNIPLISGGYPAGYSFQSQPAQIIQPPLPPVPQTIMNGGGYPNGFSRSTDSAFGEMKIVRHADSPQLSSSGRGTGASTPPLKTSRPVTPVQPQPMGLPTNRAKLVPGRMSNTKLDKRREVPSTAV